MEITYQNGTLQTKNIETVKIRLFLAKSQLRKLLTRDGKKEWIEGCKRVFTKLVKDTLWEDFKKPEGGLAERHIGN